MNKIYRNYFEHSERLIESLNFFLFSIARSSPEIFLDPSFNISVKKIAVKISLIIEGLLALHRQNSTEQNGQNRRSKELIKKNAKTILPLDSNRDIIITVCA